MPINTRNLSLALWGGLITLLLLLVAGSFYFIQSNHRIDKQQAEAIADNQFELLSTVLLEHLRSGNYEDLDPVIQAWGIRNESALEIQLRAGNGFLISRFTRESTSPHRYSQQATLNYSYSGTADLSLQVDFHWIYAHRLDSALQMLLALTLVGVTGAYLIHVILKRHRENLQLKELSVQLSHTSRDSERRHSLLRALVNSIPDLIFFKDTNSVYIGCNKAFERYAGRSEKEQVDHTDLDFFDKDLAESFRENDRIILQSGKSRRNDEWVTYPDGTRVLLDTLKTPYYGPDGETLGLIGISRDITEMRQNQEQLETLAYYDALTRLPNRRLFTDRLTQAMAIVERHGHFLAVCYLDLDGFKQVNDVLGHKAGDQLLVEVAHRLEQVIRHEDTLARWGGDEFVLLLNNLDAADECIDALQRILDGLGAFEVEGHRFQVTGSIGVTLFPKDQSDGDTLLRHADHAMYTAKQLGRNRYHFFDAEYEWKITAEREQVDRIGEAIAYGELRVHYQPKVDLRRHRINGVEALVRWQHPTEGLLPPARFLSHIEGRQLQVQLDWWVLSQATIQLEQWQQRGFDLELSVNISASTLMEPKFTPRLAELLAAHPQVRPDTLVLEILETAAIKDLDEISSLIHSCRKLGVIFSLDDFGTGYSSLTYFQKLDISELKIDKSFVIDMLDDEYDLKLVSVTIQLAQTFGVSVIAEGVESAAHGVRLMELGCYRAQGFAIAQAMPSRAFEVWMEGYRFPEEWQKVPARVIEMPRR